MKKVFISITMIICSVVAAVAATNTAEFIAYVADANDATSKDMSIYLENASYSPAFVNKQDATKMNRVAGKPYVYTLVEDKKCGATGTNNLEGTYIVVCTTSATRYVFSFSNVAGRNLGLKDHTTQTITPITTTDTYEFEAAANTTIADRFEIVEAVPAEPVICYQYGNLIITGHKGAKVKVLDMEGEVAITEQTLATDDEVISLSALTKGEKYQVIVGEKTMIIRVQ